MSSKDPFLNRVNRAFKDPGCALEIEVVSGKRLRQKD